MLGSCRKLKSLTISRYNNVASLERLPHLPSLEHLSIIKTNINELDGVDKFRALRRLEVNHASALKRINAAKYLVDLNEISLDACKKVADFNTLGEIKSLHKIVLSNCGEIPSLAFVRKLHFLKFISFVKTNVLDGDIAPCERIKYVGFDDKRHYNRKMKDFPWPDK